MKPIIAAIPALVFGLGQTISAADPLDVWTTANSGTQNILGSVAYGKGQFVAAGYGGAIVTSPDGTVWTRRNSGITNFIGPVVYGGGAFMAFTALGGFSYGAYPVQTLTSVDGVAWTLHDRGATGPVRAVTYGGGLFVAAGGPAGGGTIATSPDGVNWTVRLSAVAAPLIDVAYGNDRFLAVYDGTGGGGSVEAGSSDGTNWWVQPGLAPYGGGHLAYGNSLWVAVGGYLGQNNRQQVEHAVIYSSTDGTNWFKRVDDVTGPPNMLAAVAYGGGQFVAVGAGVPGTTSIYTSADGTNWVARTGAGYYGTFGVGYANGQFLTVGAGGAINRSGVIGKLGASLSPGGQLLGTITGVTGQSFAIENSADLAAWSVLTNVIISNGVAQFNDPQSGAAGRRFYKGMLVNQ